MLCVERETGARSLELRLNCSWIAGRFELMPLSYWWTSDLQSADDDNLTSEIRRLDSYYSARLLYSGVSPGRVAVRLLSSLFCGVVTPLICFMQFCMNMYRDNL